MSTVCDGLTKRETMMHQCYNYAHSSTAGRTTQDKPEALSTISLFDSPTYSFKHVLYKVHF